MVYIKYTYKEVKEIIEENGCKLLSQEYINAATNLKIQCKCGREFSTTFNRFRYGRTRPKNQCDVCSGHKHDIESIRKLVEAKGFKLKSNSYKNFQEPLILECKCGNTFSVLLSTLRNGKTQCNMCSIGRENSVLSKEEVQKKIESFGLKMLSDYVDAKTKIDVLCKCGNIFQISYSKMISRKKIACNVCTKSKSNIEILAENYLLKMKIKFKSQVCFKDLKTNVHTPLKFDLGLYTLDGKLKCLIELDGQQHFKLHRIYAKTEEELRWIQIRDKMKDDYCKQNNIPLYRIPYWEFNKINEKLLQILKYENLVPSLQ